jgi:2-dehydro-3-deoxyphosphogalactonate aldolase
MTLDDAMAEMPLIAILRGLRPEEAVGIVQALFDAGLRIVEVPLNSPDPLTSIKTIAETFSRRMVCGAGTVLSVDRVMAVAEAGGRIIVSPDTRADVIRTTIKEGLIPLPGFATATEAFTAYDAGARRLKLFPAATYGAAHIKALKAVLPADAEILAVGGAGVANLGEWWSAGARGFGLGSELYRPGQTPEGTFDKAKALVEAFRSLQAA